MVTMNYSEAVVKLSHHLTSEFLIELYEYARSALPEEEIVKRFLVSTGDLRFLPDLSTFYGRKVSIFTAVNRPIYRILFTGSQYKKDINFGA
jgi:hypothetical protein